MYRLITVNRAAQQPVAHRATWVQECGHNIHYALIDCFAPCRFRTSTPSNSDTCEP